MGLISLCLFTMLGGLAAGTYVFETCFGRQRSSERPWLTPLVVVGLFAVGLIAAATHLGNVGKAMEAVLSGYINFGAGMTQEVVVCAAFFLLAIVDLIISFAKKETPYALRVITAVIGLLCIFMMGMAYVDVLAVEAWANASATILTFLCGDLAMGLGLFGVLNNVKYGEDKKIATTSYVVNAALAASLLLEISAFASAGEDVLTQIAGLIVAPICSLAAVAMASKTKGNTTAMIVCLCSIVGIAIARYGFYAICTVL